MGLKTKKQAREEKYIKLGFKWEFLRRNKNYINDYNNYVANCRKKYKITSISNSEFTTYKKELNNIFAKKYGIKMPFNFNISFFELEKHIRKPLTENLKKTIENDRVNLKKDIARFNKKNEYYRQRFLRHGEKFLYWHSYLAKAPEIPYYLNGKYKAFLLAEIINNFISYGSSVKSSAEESQYDEIQNKTIKITLDFSAPFSKIMSDIKRDMEFWYSQLNPTIKDIKLRLNDYKRLLEIYDLKERKGWSWEKLTKKFKRKKIWKISGTFDKADKLKKNKYKYLTREVKRDYNTCKRFVGGDYSKIW